MGWEGLEEVPEYIAAYGDGYIDAVADLGLLDLQDRVATEDRDRARAACRQALAAMAMKAIAEGVAEGDIGVEVIDG